jgi:hypothetical protein
MDPNETLALIRELSAKIIGQVLDDDNHDAIMLAEACQALDGWLCRGGFKPRDWRLTVDQVDGVSKVVARS